MNFNGKKVKINQRIFQVLGKSAELAGMTMDKFVEFLGKHDVDIYQNTEKELAHEVGFINNLADENS